MRTVPLLSVFAVGLVLLGFLFFANRPPTPVVFTAIDASLPPGEAMAEAVQAWLDTLTPELRTEAMFAFEDEERYNWHYTPRERSGVTIGAMNAEQRLAALSALQTTLSNQGYLKATHIMYLEEVLRMLENGAPHRDPERYHFSVFGMPGPEAPWGFRVEGHHLSLNVSSVSDELVATTPSFMGANPALVPQGPKTGFRILATEEDLARALLGMLSEAQRQQAIISGDAPRDIVTGVDRMAQLESFAGLPASAMDAAQQAMLMRLVETYIHNQRDDLAAVQLHKIREAGFENLHFAWAGDTERGPGHPHYYRIHGPTLLIEYDNTQNDANHIHTVVRDLADDWGADLLEQHYRESPHHQQRQD